MDILLRQVRIIDPSSPLHHQVTDVFIQNGMIAETGTIARAADQEISMEGLCISPGWVDLFAGFCDPGFEYKETLETGANAAAAGGFTDVFVLPNTNPVLHNKAGIEYIVQRSRSLPVHIRPIAAITRNTEGKELAEMYDMHHSGAVAFSDGTSPVQSSGLLLKALQYVRAIDRTIIQLPEDQAISRTGLMNEGIVSTRLGLPGKPAISEELMIRRDIELAKYTSSRLHITGVSTAASVALIRAAKQEGVAISCSVTPYHLFFTDEDLTGYDTNLKVNPPLRTKADRDALRAAVLEGHIDCITSHHLPEDPDHKQVEFEYAAFGMSGLETSFAIARTALPGLSMDALVDLFARNARKLFPLPDITIRKDAPASLALFQPDSEWHPQTLQSRSKNTPFTGRTLTGRPAGIINKDTLFLNQLV